VTTTGKKKGTCIFGGKEEKAQKAGAGLGPRGALMIGLNFPGDI